MDDIACSFIDTAYNGESFFVRHADSTGAGNPYEKLKRALRAGGMVCALFHRQPPVRSAQDWQNRRQGHQPLWG
jgi:hypothetical protein